MQPCILRLEWFQLMSLRIAPHKLSVHVQVLKLVFCSLEHWPSPAVMLWCWQCTALYYQPPVVVFITLMGHVTRSSQLWCLRIRLAHSNPHLTPSLRDDHYWSMVSATQQEVARHSQAEDIYSKQMLRHFASSMATKMPEQLHYLDSCLPKASKKHPESIQKASNSMYLRSNTTPGSWGVSRSQKRFRQKVNALIALCRTKHPQL